MQGISLRLLLSFLILTNSLIDASGSVIHNFNGEIASVTVPLHPPSNSDDAKIFLPADCYVINATMTVCGIHENGSFQYPKAPSISLNDTSLWRFDGTDYGSFGLQDKFLNEKTNLEVDYGYGGGCATIGFRIPWGATVKNATVNLGCFGPERLLQIADIQGVAGTYARAGSSIACAGDINGDGYDDIIIGTPACNVSGTYSGAVYIYLGGPDLSLTPAMTLYGGSSYDYFGCSVAGVGDVNQDGYDDIIIGADGNSSQTMYGGAAFIYYGGQHFKNWPGVTIIGSVKRGYLGFSVSGAGDVNHDGYNDVIVGEPEGYINSGTTGVAYIFFGGSPMDNKADLNFSGENAYDLFGKSVAGAGDVNKDGYDDIIVGAPQANYYFGNAYLFFGGESSDGKPDLIFHGDAESSGFGWSVSGAQDVNGDGYNDIIIGAPYENSAGEVYIYFGGGSMDNISDVNISGNAVVTDFGHSVSGAGDVNHDGFNDLIIGSPYNDGSGMAFVYFGGLQINTSADLICTGENTSDVFGWAVSEGGDINGDGYTDFLIGAPMHDGNGKDAGALYVYSFAPFLMGPEIKINQTSFWYASCAAGFRLIPDFSYVLNSFINMNPADGHDNFGNYWIDIPVQFMAAGEGKMVIQELNVTYNCYILVKDFSKPLNDYILAHKTEINAEGYLTIPLILNSASAGRLKLQDLNITIDEQPVSITPIPTQYIDEDRINPKLIDLTSFFRDDYDSVNDLKFNIVSATQSDIFFVGVTDNHYLSVDTLSGDANDNQTGTINIVVRCTDLRGLNTDSNSFAIVVQNVNDAPIITSSPSLEATKGVEYRYQLYAIDGDNDTFSFSLENGPENMTLDSRSGEIQWTPDNAGIHNISIGVSDGKLKSYQNFSIIVTILNKSPIFISKPETNVTAGAIFIYEAKAMDSNGDRLNYSLLTWPGSMTIDHISGKIVWEPGESDIGNYSVIVSVSDGKGGEVHQEFVIWVHAIMKPIVSITQPRPGSIVSGRYTFNGKVERGSSDILGVQLKIDYGEWINVTGYESWALEMDTTSLRDGNHKLQVRAYDNNSFSEMVTVDFETLNEKTISIESLTLIVGIIFLIIMVFDVFIIRNRKSKK